MNVGIVCEYNPLHRGHRKQMEAIRAEFGADTGIVCAMSGNFVQRGAPAIFDKSLRAKAAVACGADLVVELPLTVCLSSAEGFASGGVAILSKLCDILCFGSETGNRESLMATAQALLQADFQPHLRRELDTGKSFPAARQAALTAMGLSSDLLNRPNDILSVEYCKAILSQGSPLDIFPIQRKGDYHDRKPDPENPSATALRQLLLSGGDWRPYVPEEAADLFENAPLHSLAAGEKAVLYRLRTMTEAELSRLPYGGEGLWRKLLHARQAETTLEDILTAMKSKRYTRTRLDRMVLCAVLGITEESLLSPAPYARILAFNDRGREILKNSTHRAFFKNAGETPDSPCWDLERRSGDVYGLFAIDGPEAPGMESKRRIYYDKGRKS